MYRIYHLVVLSNKFFFCVRFRNDADGSRQLYSERTDENETKDGGGVLRGNRPAEQPVANRRGLITAVSRTETAISPVCRTVSDRRWRVCEQCLLELVAFADHQHGVFFGFFEVELIADLEATLFQDVNDDLVLDVGFANHSFRFRV